MAKGTPAEHEGSQNVKLLASADIETLRVIPLALPNLFPAQGDNPEEFI
ncbi:hypothetical protein [Gracilimonas sp.]|nr:hypothetical protein [Gracilimonas sp.]